MKQITNLYPSFPECWAYWGDILLNNNQYKEALSAYKTAIECWEKRNSLDLLFVCKNRGLDYCNDMIQKIVDSKKNIKFIKYLDQSH